MREGMTGNIIRAPYRITRREIRQNRETTFYVFGDNMLRKGLGGQAREMRNEPNAIGIPTKYFPAMEDQRAFFTDAAMDDHDVMSDIDDAIYRIDRLLDEGYDVVIPLAGVGTGLSELPLRAPRLFNYITQKLQFLERKYNPLAAKRRNERQYK
jgi:hypothetical protein